MATIPLLYNIALQSKIKFRFPVLATFIIYAIYSSSFTANLFGMGSLGPARVANVNQYLAVLSLIGIAFYWSGWISKKRIFAPVAKKKTQQHLEKNDSVILPAVLILVFCFIFASVIISTDDVNAIMSISATSSLISDEAKNYDLEYEKRLELLKSDDKEIQLDKFQNKPYVLFFDDITTDRSDWRNTAMANFYGKDYVELKYEETD